MDPSNADPGSQGGSSNSIMARSPEAGSDRMNRSLPHPRDGPYQCPRCEGFFRTSTVFAKHMRSHYKSEREDRKRRRMETRRRRIANRGLTGGPNGHDDSTYESDEAEVETLAGNAKAKDAEAQEKEMENVQGSGRARGDLKTKEKPAI